MIRPAAMLLLVLLAGCLAPRTAVETTDRVTVWLDNCDVTVHAAATGLYPKAPGVADEAPAPSRPTPMQGDPAPACTLSPAQVQRLETWAAGFPMVGALEP